MAARSRKSSRQRSKENPELRTPASEELLEEYLAGQPFDGADEPVVLCTSLGRGQIALALAGSISRARVTCCAFDLYLAEQMRSFLDQYWIEDDDDNATDEFHHKIDVLCEPDFPEVAADLVVMPVKKTGDAELTRDWLQTGFLRLKVKGQLWAAVDNGRDHWLHEEMKKLFPKVTRLPEKRGVVYIASKTGEPKKVKNFWADFEFRDPGMREREAGTGDRGPGRRKSDEDERRLIRGVSRPGVFSHRRVDEGAMALMNVMEIHPGDRVADIGCGSGMVGIAAALRHPGVTVLALDSNPRAIECTLKGAELNGVTSLTAKLDANAACEPRGTFDVVVGNPPYYSNYRIAEIFLGGAWRGLKPGGRVWMVTKQPNWFVERMSQMFADVEVLASRGYKVILGTKRGE